MKFFKSVLSRFRQCSEAIINLPQTFRNYYQTLKAMRRLATLRNDPQFLEALNGLLLFFQNSKINKPSSEEIDQLINHSSHMRNAWVAKKASEVPKDALVLDAGAGECQYKSLFKHANYKSQDFVGYQGTNSGPQRESWKYGEIDIVSDIASIPVVSGTFDVVLCTEVLEHVPNPIDAIHEFSRVLKSGGRLLLSAPLGAGLHQEPHHYYGGFTPHFYKKFLEEVGFEDIKIIPLGGLLKHVAQETHRVARIIGSDKNALPASINLSYMLSEWVSSELSSLDHLYFVPEFTVGYLVEATKKFKNYD